MPVGHRCQNVCYTPVRQAGCAPAFFFFLLTQGDTGAGVQAEAIEDDLPEYADDRGHSAHHPGYRRRQLRFLSLKLFSQVRATPRPGHRPQSLCGAVLPA